MKKVFRVYYMKEAWLPHGISGKEPSLSLLANTHQIVAVIKADDLEDVFYQMQGENWSPNGEARDLITTLHLVHTSMSVGDIAVDSDGNVFVVQAFGFKNLGNKNLGELLEPK